jgi:hypothetical protein
MSARGILASCECLLIYRLPDVAPDPLLMYYSGE